MSNNYDNWERLVKVVLRREHDRQLALAVSRESSFNSGYSSSFRSEFDYDHNPQLEANTVNLLRDTSAPQVSSFLGKAGIVGLEKAVKVLGTIGSSMTNRKFGGVTSGVSLKRNEISMLAFEVANTIAKGVNLLQSLSKANIQILHVEILHSEGVQNLVSTDMSELLRIAAADKREELDVFSHEVTRFGNLLENAQFHNLDRLFSKLDSDPALQKQPRKAKKTIKELASLAQHTFELYHELPTLEKLDQDYRRKVEQLDSLPPSPKGEGVAVLQSELKDQRKLVQLTKKKRELVQSLKMKSLWSRSLEEVVEKLVDVIVLIHRSILESFGDNGLTSSGEATTDNPEKLGVTGLSSRYADIFTQIDYIASHPIIDSQIRDTLYDGLPANVQDALLSRLQIIDKEEKFTAREIKVQMEKTLNWLVPLATNTTAKSLKRIDMPDDVPNNLIRFQTLYHADKQKADSYILELVAWLHYIVRLDLDIKDGLGPRFLARRKRIR